MRKVIYLCSIGSNGFEQEDKFQLKLTELIWYRPKNSKFGFII